MRQNKSGEAGDNMSGAQFSVRYASMMELLQFANSVRENAIIGSPAWFESDHFDIVARKPADAPAATTALMLQSLLASGFQARPA